MRLSDTLSSLRILLASSGMMSPQVQAGLEHAIHILTEIKNIGTDKDALILYALEEVKTT